VTEELTDKQIKEELEGIDKFNQQVDAFKFYDGPDRDRSYVELKKYYEGLPRSIGVSSKLPELEGLIEGFKEGELIVISGRTGEGKTTFAQSLIRDFSDDGNASLLMSYEVGTQDIIKRFAVPTLNLAMQTEVKAYDLVWLEQRIWEGIAKFKIKAVFIDHLHYLIDFATPSSNTSFVIGKTLRALKIMALKTHVPIFLISHLTKLSTGTEPTINDLRDSSFIGQEADTVLMIWRDDERTSNKSFVKVGKSRRTGNRETIQVQLENGRFRETYNG